MFKLFAPECLAIVAIHTRNHHANYHALGETVIVCGCRRRQWGGAGMEERRVQLTTARPEWRGHTDVDGWRLKESWALEVEAKGGYGLAAPFKGARVPQFDLNRSDPDRKTWFLAVQAPDATVGACGIHLVGTVDQLATLPAALKAAHAGERESVVRAEHVGVGIDGSDATLFVPELTMYGARPWRGGLDVSFSWPGLDSAVCWTWAERGLLSLADLLEVLLARCAEVDEGKRIGILDRAEESPMSA